MTNPEETIAKTRRQSIELALAAAIRRALAERGAKATGATIDRLLAAEKDKLAAKEELKP